ncbi:MAG TPA: MerR family transcriptional regulator [Chloroflexota bacterium]|nr:MerR family transcriptional regulator [Chloroflexota bacterium]
MYRPQDVAEKLGIAPSTLRLWSQHFANQLSNAARKAPSAGGGAPAQRRYTDDDIRVLSQVKSLLSQGQTYDDVKLKLRGEAAKQEVAQATATTQSTTTVAVFTEEAQSSLLAMKEALAAKDKTIGALKESLTFMDAYLHAIREDREDARGKTQLLEKELDKLRTQNRELMDKVSKPWWKILLGLP